MRIETVLVWDAAHRQWVHTVQLAERLEARYLAPDEPIPEDLLPDISWLACNEEDGEL